MKTMPFACLTRKIMGGTDVYIGWWGGLLCLGIPKASFGPKSRGIHAYQGSCGFPGGQKRTIARIYFSNAPTCKMGPWSWKLVCWKRCMFSLTSSSCFTMLTEEVETSPNAIKRDKRYLSSPQSYGCHTKWVNISGHPGHPLANQYENPRHDGTLERKSCYWMQRLARRCPRYKARNTGSKFTEWTRQVNRSGCWSHFAQCRRVRRS